MDIQSIKLHSLQITAEAALFVTKKLSFVLFEILCFYACYPKASSLQQPKDTFITRQITSQHLPNIKTEVSTMAHEKFAF